MHRKCILAEDEFLFDELLQNPLGTKGRIIRDFQLSEEILKNASLKGFPRYFLG